MCKRLVLIVVLFIAVEWDEAMSIGFDLNYGSTYVLSIKFQRMIGDNLWILFSEILVINILGDI